MLNTPAIATERKGGCRCGNVRYAIKGAPLVVGLCHCTDCRKATGSAFLLYGDWSSHSFTVEGEYSTYEGRSFCPRCGSRLFHLSDKSVEINLGSMDDAPTDLVPQREGWIKRREPWLLPVAFADQHREDP